MIMTLQQRTGQAISVNLGHPLKFVGCCPVIGIRGLDGPDISQFVEETYKLFGMIGDYPSEASAPQNGSLNWWVTVRYVGMEYINAFACCSLIIFI